MNPYIENKIELGVDFINTYDPMVVPVDKLTSPQDVFQFMRAHGLNLNGEVEARDIPILHEARQQLFEVFTMENPTDAARAINRILQDGDLRMEIEVSGAQVEAVPHAAPHLSTAQQLMTEAALGVALALQHYGTERLRICESSPCQEAFVDTSKNGRRRYCSNTCSTRVNVAAFRDRRK